MADWFHGTVGPHLVAQGFELRSPALEHAWPLQYFRLKETRIEIIGCHWHHSIGDPESEIYAQAGVFLRAVPACNDSNEAGVDGLPVVCTLDSHFRQRLWPTWLRFPAWPRPGTWIVKEPGPHLNRCLADIYKKIDGVLPWFDRFDHAADVYAAVLKKQKVGNRLPGSWGYVQAHPLLRGYLALECGEWEDAARCLTAVLALRSPYHDLDPTQPEHLYHRNRSRIEAALRRAEFQLQKAGKKLS